MATIEELQARVEGLNQALADGVRQVSVRGQITTYQTTASLIEARNDAERQLRALEEAAAPRGRFRMLYQAGRGYD